MEIDYLEKHNYQGLFDINVIQLIDRALAAVQPMTVEERQLVKEMRENMGEQDNG